MPLKYNLPASFYVVVKGYKDYEKTLCTLRELGIRFLSPSVDSESYAVSLHKRGLHKAYLYVNYDIEQGYVFFAKSVVQHSIPLTLKQVKKYAQFRVAK